MHRNQPVTDFSFKPLVSPEEAKINLFMCPTDEEQEL